MLKRLYDIVLLLKEYVVVAVFLSVSVFLLAFNDTPQMREIRAYAIVAVGLLQNSLSVLPNYLNLRRENEALRELNLALSDEVSRLREGKLENLRLRQLLNLKELGEHRYTGANIVGKNLQLLRNTITLDVGENEGVQVNMPIVSERGLVGKVISTTGHYSIGQILLNKDVRVSAKVQRSRVDGIVRWDGGHDLLLQNVARTDDVQTGDLVITSDYSAFFPKGIKVGVVSETRPLPGSLFQAVTVKPAVDFTALEEVFVMQFKADSSRTVLEQRGR
jgi:rod shape-determining protein MreC